MEVEKYRFLLSITEIFGWAASDELTCCVQRALESSYDARMNLDCFSLNLFQLKKFVESKHQKKVRTIESLEQVTCWSSNVKNTHRSNLPQVRVVSRRPPRPALFESCWFHSFWVTEKKCPQRPKRAISGSDFLVAAN